MWTAQEAAEKSQYYRHDFIYNKICEAINNGLTETYYFRKMSQYVKDIFEDLGYTIKISESPESNDGYITFIYW